MSFFKTLSPRALQASHIMCDALFKRGAPLLPPSETIDALTHCLMTTACMMSLTPRQVIDAFIDHVRSQNIEAIGEELNRLSSVNTPLM